MPTARRPHTISDVKAIRLLGSPLRQAILDLIEARGPGTVAELSESLRRAPDRLYYHVRLLERAGLLIAGDSVNGKGRREATFDVPGRPLRLKYDLPADSHRRALSRVLDSMLRTARRDTRTAAARRDVRGDGPRRELWVGRMEVALSGRDLAEVNAALRRLHEVIGRAQLRRAPAGKYYQFTWALSPTTR